MSETLWSATRAVARMIPGNIVVDGTATSDGLAGKTTLVDNAAWFMSPTTLPPDDYFNGGTIWFEDCTNTGLEGDTALITDYATATGTYTFAAADAQTKSGDTYSATNREYPRFILRQAVNWALSQVGGEDLQNTATTTTANQMTYDLPTGVYNIKRVELATSLSSPYGYIPLSHWREINDDIAFDEGFQPTSTGYILRLTYRIPFSELTTDAGTLADLANMNWIRWAGVYYCLRWKLGITAGDDETARTFLKEAIAEAERSMKLYKPKMQQMERDWPRSAWDYRSGISHTDEPNKVHL